jgi:hypothetical protein
MDVLRRLSAAAFALAFLLAACSSTDNAQPTDLPLNATSGGAAADLPDPCGLIDQADADDVFGSGVAAGEPGETPGSGGSVSGRDCDWKQGLSTLSATIFVSTNYLVPVDVCDWCEPIDGYGDEAWGGITDLGSGGGSLMVVADGLGVQVEAYGPDVTIDQLGAMAESLLAGLP